MSAFLTGLLGAVVGLVVLVLVAYLWIKRKLTRIAKDLGLAFSGGVPPFRVTLQACDGPSWRNDAAVSAISDALSTAGYRGAGDYLIDEMPGVVLRGFAHPKAATLAALYEHPQLPDPQLDILRLHDDRQHVLATTAADDGLDAPPNKIVHRFDALPSESDALASTVNAMQEKVLIEGKDREPIPVGAKLFATVFATAYANEMDWRIQRGGVTVDEVRRVAIMGGQQSPSDREVEVVRGMWQSAIDEFISDEAQRAFLAAGTVSATDWEQLRERILVVHEHSAVGELVGGLAEDLLIEDEDDDDVDDDAYEASHQQLVESMRSHFANADPVSGFSAARNALPALAGFEHLGDVARPWRAAIYARPEAAG